jgi:Lrp/AsnC family transcriptional regulator of ectoine degradation
MKLDARDLDILRVLADEGRITKAGLAARVGLSASPCLERLRRLEEAGLIEGYNARISLRKLGPHVTAGLSHLADNGTCEVIGPAGAFAFT